MKRLKITQVLVSVLFILVILLMLRCSTNLADGGSEAGNAKIIGIIVTKSGTPSFGTQVKLIDNEYNPLKDAVLPDSMIDTTDASGSYCFIAQKNRTYTVEAVHPVQLTRLLITGLTAQADSLIVPADTLKQPGMIKLFLPDTIDTAEGYVFVKGTTLLKKLAAVSPINGGGYSLFIDSVPAAQLPGFHYDKANDPSGPELISDTVIVSSSDTTATEAFVYWGNYTKENSGLPNNEINEMRIASDGRIWIATSDGAAVFDGTGWTHYSTANTDLPSNVIMGLNFDRNGAVWFATLGGVASFDGSQWTVLDSAHSGLPTNYCVSIAVDRKDTLWCGMYDGIAKYTGTSWVVYDTVNTSLPSCRVEDIAVDSSGYVWFATFNSILKYDNGAWEIYNTGNSSITSNLVFEVDVDKNDNKWFGYDNGVSRFDNSTWTGFDLNSSAALDSRVIQIYTDARNDVWIGSFYGLTRFDGVGWTDYIGEQYARLDNKRIYAIAVDKDENVWIGTYNSGVFVFGPTMK